jgi:hypothetical protein
MQPLKRPFVANNVSRELLLPELTSGGGPPEEMTFMSVPETTMNENDGAMLWKGQIRSGRQAAVTNPVAEAAGMQSASDDHLGRSVAPANPSHVQATLFRRQDIH